MWPTCHHSGFNDVELSDFYKVKGSQITKDQKQQQVDVTEIWLKTPQQNWLSANKPVESRSQVCVSPWVLSAIGLMTSICIFQLLRFMNWMVLSGSWILICIYKYVKTYLWISTVVFATRYALTSKPHLASPLLSLETHKYNFHRVINMSTESTPFTYTWNFGRSSNRMKQTIAILAASNPTWATHHEATQVIQKHISMAGFSYSQE